MLYKQVLAKSDNTEFFSLKEFMMTLKLNKQSEDVILSRKRKILSCKGTCDLLKNFPTLAVKRILPSFLLMFVKRCLNLLVLTLIFLQHIFLFLIIQSYILLYITRLGLNFKPTYNHDYLFSTLHSKKTTSAVTFQIL